MASTLEHQNSPLITPKRVVAAPEEAFTILPSWARLIEVLHPGGTATAWSAIAPTIIVVVGRTQLADAGFSSFQYAALYELTRIPGIGVALNGDGKGRFYARITIQDAPEDLTTVSRFLSDAGPYDQIRTTGTPSSDMRGDNLEALPASRRGKYARSIVLHHAKRLATAWEERGDMPEHLTSSTYLENLRRLLRAVDAEAAGADQIEALRQVEHEPSAV
ncbi:hypothetical protein ASC75_08475 [Aminobacter sp. DSM 101952]|uniref:hypothetical protein n=1 Tax=Aminobacter sp. DSM 101952 TaxID=2735891 RepID=UPI0006F45504|nr:hypothetical protein [Aminobacter sp. DSM 101952]KQU66662.1 hypothetical protein ASC75_08475 [Aminobacter sp. DSM 101952]